MSEARAIYTVNPKNFLTMNELRERPCSLPFSNSNYAAPTPKEVQSLFHIAGWTQTEAADKLGVYSDSSGSVTIRRWKSVDANYRFPDRKKKLNVIPYAAWRLGLILAGVVSSDE